MRFRTLLAASFSLLCVPFAGAQVLVTTSGDYNVVTTAQAVSVTDSENYNGNFVGSAFSRSAESYAEYTDPELGWHYAHGAASLFWTTSTSGGVTTLSGGVGGIAEAFSNGLDTYALGAASVAVYFDITTLANVHVDSEGTYDSQMYMWNGSGWDQVLTLMGPDDIVLGAGSYRWNSGAGEQVTGTNYYSSGIQFSVAAQAVPEPGTMAALGLGAAVLLRRRAKRA